MRVKTLILFVCSVVFFCLTLKFKRDLDKLSKSMDMVLESVKLYGNVNRRFYRAQYGNPRDTFAEIPIGKDTIQWKATYYIPKLFYK
jgi:hypothetical protein